MFSCRLIVLISVTLFADSVFAQRVLECPDCEDVASDPAEQEYALVCVTNRTDHNVPFRVQWMAEGQNWQEYDRFLPEDYQGFHWPYGEGEGKSPRFRIVFFSSPGSKLNTTGLDLKKKRSRSAETRCKGQCCSDAYRYGFLEENGRIVLVSETE